jgi:LuxR family maltose regulon positive regulatory protein
VPHTKTTVPGRGAGHVPRRRLVATLDAVAENTLILISAPAGYGKTRLLAEWAAPRLGSMAWVSLDEGDNDDHSFWSAVLTALAACPAVPETSCVGRVPVPAEPSQDAAFLAAVAVALDALPEPVWLVLDDVHELVAGGPRHGLEFLFRERPASLRLVLASRTDPSLPIARLRLAGQLCEVRARDLAFSVAEAATMLRDADLLLRPDQLRVLVDQTEGWAAGLRLAAMSLRRVDDRDGFLVDLAANSRALADYLGAEILSPLPADTVDLLAALSICERVTADLAAALSDRPNAAEVLDVLERETFLVQSWGAGRSSYRLPALLRAHLRADLERRQPQRITALHRAAADWFVGKNDPVRALEHARRGGDVDQVARLVRGHGVAFVAEGELTALSSALAWLDTTVWQDSSWVRLMAALIAVERGEVRQARARADRAAACWPAEPEPDLVALDELVRARLAAVALIRPAPAELLAENAGTGEADDELGTLAGLERAMIRLIAGDQPTARALATAAVDDARRLGRSYLTARALTTLAALDAVTGDHRALATLTDEADALLRESDLGSTAGAALCGALRAYDALLRAEPAACLQLLADVPGDISEMGGLRAGWMALRGAATCDLGGLAEGLEELTSARALAELSNTMSEVDALVVLLEHRAAGLAGKPALARAVSAWAGKVLGDSGEVLLLRAIDQVGLGHHREATVALRPLLDDAVPVRLPWTRIEAHVQVCRLALRDGRRVQARTALRRVLALADSMGVLRPLVLAPESVAELLARHLGSFGPLDELAARALDIRRTRAGVPPAALTDRELAVLRQLSTPRSIDEIAAELDVSASTVKSHVRSIYAKLGVSSRRQAVSRSRLHSQPRHRGGSWIERDRGGG